LAHEGVSELAIYDPSAASVDALLARLRPQFLRTTFRRQAQPLAADRDMVVNASPFGLKYEEDPLPMDPAGISPGTLVCDIIMKPPTTRFLHAALTCGLPVHRGRHMLDQQVPAYLSFFGLDDLASRIRVTSESILLSD
jgi:shikimate dehydrogenase